MNVALLGFGGTVVEEGIKRALPCLPPPSLSALVS